MILFFSPGVGGSIPFYRHVDTLDEKWDLMQYCLHGGITGRVMSTHSAHYL